MGWNDDVDEIEELEELERCGALDERRERKREGLMKALVKPTGEKLEVISTSNIKRKLKEAEEKRLEAEETRKRVSLIERYRRIKEEVRELEK